MILTTGGVLAIAAVGLVHALGSVREGGAGAPDVRREVQKGRKKEGRTADGRRLARD
ncbi:MAG: hypothetical protein AB7G17_08670 [Phycisphaerales bacterium]